MKIYFIGIGGIGTSALAQYYLTQGHAVFGSDLSEGAMTKILKQKGAKVFVGPHKASNVKKGLDLVVYTNATEKNNPELLQAKKLKIKTKNYPQALGELTRRMKTVAVAGMHGKSTTTAMLAVAAIEAGLDPTVIVGTRLKEFGGSNFRVGRGNLLIIEADEYKAALLNYRPDVAVVLNFEKEHLDFYRDLAHIKKTFTEFLKNIKSGGVAVLNRDDKNVGKLALSAGRAGNTSPTSKRNQILFSLKDETATKIKKVLHVPGTHNLSNALAVFETLKFLGVNENKILAGLKKFQGTWRRLEYRGKLKGALIYDDYGHHPTEIKATLEAARQMLLPKARLWCVFQPHQYQRTFKLFAEFARAFNLADKVLLLDIYSVPGREKETIKKKVSSVKLARAIQNKNVRYVESFPRAAEILKKELETGDVCLIMGAGDIIKLTGMIFA